LAWGSAHDVHLKSVITSKKAILKVMFFKPFLFPSEQLFVDSRIRTIKQLYLQHIIKHLLNNKIAINTISHVYGTRANVSRNATYLKKRNSASQRHFLYYAPKVYNKFNKFLSKRQIQVFSNNKNKTIDMFLDDLSPLDLSEIFTITS